MAMLDRRRTGGRHTCNSYKSAIATQETGEAWRCTGLARMSMELGFRWLCTPLDNTCESRAPALPRGVVLSRCPLLEPSVACHLDLDVGIGRGWLLSTFGMMEMGVGVRTDSTPHLAKRLESSATNCVCRVVVCHLEHTTLYPSTCSG